MGENYYEVLGLSQGAGQDEIKKAYFRLVRQCSPEKDPERFREIREAYENLKEGENRKDVLTMEAPDEPFAKKMLSQIKNSFSGRQYGLAARTADEAIRIYGKWECFLYYRSLAQRLSGNTGKSVSGFEELVKRWPDKAVYYRELAISRLERGFVNKAQEAFGDAYERGVRDEEFLYLYANNSVDRGLFEKAFELADELIEEEKKHLRTGMDVVLDTLALQISILDQANRPVSRVLQECLYVTEAVPSMLREYPEELMEIYSGFVLRKDDMTETEKELLKQLKETLKFHLSEENEELWNTVEEFSEIIGMDHDPEIPIWYTASLHGYKEVEEPAFGRYVILDLSLCILEEWPENRELLRKIEQNYPLSYQPIADFVKRLETYADTGRISELRDRLLKDYDRLGKAFDGGFYFEKYPHRKPNRVRVIRENNGEPFVRTDRKIGRNEPCPCGSGKKYKNCCGR